MKVKNIKSFIEFYKTLEVTTCLTNDERSKKLIKENRPKKNSHKNTDLSNISEKNENTRQSKLNALQSKIKKINCDLKDIATNCVFADGNIFSEIMFIGEAPGAEEDKSGKPFVGQAGLLLDKMFSFIDLNREKNFYLTNILFWRPPGNRTPTNKEISICLNATKEHIEIIQPKLLVLVGSTAAKALLNSQDGITNLRNGLHQYINTTNNIKIDTKAIFHPAYLLRNPIEKKRMWEDILEIDKIIHKNKIKR